MGIIDYADHGTGLWHEDCRGCDQRCSWSDCAGERKEENKLRRTLARIEELVREYEVDTIVLGFPKHMNNDVGERAKKSLEFKEMLVRRTGLDVVMWDERLTTVEAERTLIESQVRRENRKQYIDKIAAVFILQGYLDSIYLKKKAEEEN